MLDAQHCVSSTGIGEIITTSSGLKYQDVFIGQTGDTPRPGTVVGFKAKVSIADKVLFDTANEKPVAFKVSDCAIAPYVPSHKALNRLLTFGRVPTLQVGQRPFQNILCDGVEEGLKGMRVGSKRKLFVPAELAPKGVQLPPGVPLIYEIEVTEVLPGYF